jgi:hypothetical protein
LNANCAPEGHNDGIVLRRVAREAENVEDRVVESLSLSVGMFTLVSLYCGQYLHVQELISALVAKVSAQMRARLRARLTL